MISIAGLYDLIWSSLISGVGAGWCVFAWRSIGRSFKDAHDSLMLFPALLTAANQVALLVFNDFRHTQGAPGAPWDQQTIDNGFAVWRVLVYVGLDVLVPVLAILWAISLLPLAISIKTWWTAADVDGPWEGITYGRRLQRRVRISFYERLLVRQVKAYSRVQPGGVHMIAVERAFAPHEASTTLRIRPQVLLPLDPVRHRIFDALRWSSGAQYETVDTATVLRVHWDLKQVTRGFEGRVVRVLARWDRRAITATGVVVVVLAVVSLALVPWFWSDSGPAAETTGLQQSQEYGAPRPGGSVLMEPSAARVVPEVDLQPPSHSDLCPQPAQSAATPQEHCEAVTTFTLGHPVTITALGVDAYGVLANRTVQLVVWEFDADPSTKIVQSVGPSHDWQVIRLKRPMTAAIVTATVVDAIAASSTASDQPIKLVGRYRLIGMAE